MWHSLLELRMLAACSDASCLPARSVIGLVREGLCLLAFFLKGNNVEDWFGLDLETGGGEARLPTEGQDRCVGTLSCPAAPGKQKRQMVLWEFQPWSEDDWEHSSLLEFRNPISPKGKRGRKNTWPRQFQSEFIDRARKEDIHLPGVQKQSKSWGFLWDFLGVWLAVKAKAKISDLGC